MRIATSQPYHLFMALLLLLAPAPLAAQNPETKEGITWEWVVKPEYDEMQSFSESLAGVCKYAKCGFIDKSGNIAVPLIYDRIAQFSEGLAIVEKDNKQGFVDKMGNIAVPLIYDRITQFSEGLAIVEKDNKYGFVDMSGKVIVPLKFDDADAFVDGLARVKKDNKYGFVDKIGNIVVPLKFDGADAFVDGLARVKKDNKWGYVDNIGNVAITIVYDGIAPLEDQELVIVEKDNKQGVIDKSGNIVVPIIYDTFSNFNTNLAIVKKDNKEGVIDKSGNIVVPIIYDETFFFSEGLAIVKKDNKYGFVDKSGNITVPLIYDEVTHFSEGLTRVIKDNKWGLIDKLGNIVVPVLYDDIGEFSEGLAIVKKDNKRGFVDKSGRIIIPLIYDEFGRFNKGLAIVKKDNKLGYIDKSGNIIVSLNFDEIYLFEEGLAWVKKDNKYGIIRLLDSPLPPVIATLPEISWQSPTSDQSTTSNTLAIKACIKSASQITEVSVSANEALATESAPRPVAADGCAMVVNRQVTLNVGRNVVSISAKNAAGVAKSPPLIITYTPPAPTPPPVVATAPPVISWQSPTSDQNTTNGTITVKACIKSSAQITEVGVYNGNVAWSDRAPRPVAEDGCAMVVNREVVLNAGRNTLFITARNAGGVTTSSTINITYSPATVAPVVAHAAQKRLALVIGNGAYPADRLKNPVNDARAIKQALQEVGFEVLLHEDRTGADLNRAVTEFGTRLQSGYDVALVFYAGHSVQLSDKNYLFGVDANPVNENDAPYQGIDASRLVAIMEGAKVKTKIMLLDACRNNPWEKKWAIDAGNRGFSEGRGLAEMPTPEGTFIVFATQAGKTAKDMPAASNSPFTQALIENLKTPNLEINLLFNRVKASVKQKTNNAQNPNVESGLDYDFYFRF